MSSVLLLFSVSFIFSVSLDSTLPLDFRKYFFFLLPYCFFCKVVDVDKVGPVLACLCNIDGLCMSLYVILMALVFAWALLTF